MVLMLLAKPTSVSLKVSDTHCRWGWEDDGKEDGEGRQVDARCGTMGEQIVCAKAVYPRFQGFQGPAIR